MSVIVISRGTFSGGRMLAEGLAEDLGYRCVDRDVITEKVAAAGVSHEDLLAALEKPPGILERFRHKRYLYLTLVQAALTEEVRSGRAIYHGLAGQMLLGGGCPVLRVRVIAPVEFRITMGQQRLKLSRRETIEHIEKADEDRKRWTKYLYGVSWGDPELYDLVVNLEHFDIHEAREIVAATARQPRWFDFGDSCRLALGNLARASRVKADVALNPATSNLELDVVADGGRVKVRGKVFSVDQIRHVERIAASVSGVTDVDASRLISPVPG
jgi:cytidylate kinase